MNNRFYHVYFQCFGMAEKVHKSPIPSEAALREIIRGGATIEQNLGPDCSGPWQSKEANASKVKVSLETEAIVKNKREVFMTKTFSYPSYFSNTSRDF